MLKIENLNPVTKLLCVMMLTVVIFLIDKLTVNVCLVLFLIVVRLLFKIPLHGSFRVIKSLSLLAFFIILIQTLFAPGENYIVNPLFPPHIPLLGGIGSLKWEGLIIGLVVVCRLTTLTLLFPILSRTTSPHSIALGFNRFGFPYRIAFILTMAFNQLSFFREEAFVIIDAQRLRGMQVFERSRRGCRRKLPFLSKIKAYCGLAISLMLNAMRKAQISSAAMDSRCFGVYKTRTWLDKPKMKAADFFFLFGCFSFCVLLLYIKWACV